MRHYTLVEQMATFAAGSPAVFTFTDEIPGRLAWTSASFGESFQAFYRASNADESQWEIGICDYQGGDSIDRVSVAVSSTGSAVAFSGPVKVALVAPAGAMWAVDQLNAYLSSIAVGAGAMAAGVGAYAYGADAMAVGRLATSGDSSDPKEGACAIGPAAQSRHRYATAVGYGSQTFIEGAVHFNQCFSWSGNGYTDGAETVFPSGPGGTFPALQFNSVMALEALVVANKTDQTKFYAAKITAMVRYSGGAAVVLGAPTVTEIFKTVGSTISATIAANGSAGLFGVQVSGQTGEEWVWGAEMRGVWR